jgi:hypothetical protein
MTVSRVRLALAILALLLGAAAAIVRTPAPPNGRAATKPAAFVPASGC